MYRKTYARILIINKREVNIFMFKKKKLFTKAAALAALGVVLTTGSASAARQNTTRFENNINLKLKTFCTGVVGSGAQNATQEITSRVEKHINGYCPVYFVHKKASQDTYVTMGVWIRTTFGKCNSKYLSNTGVKRGMKLVTQSQTLRNSNNGATITSIRGTVKY